MHVVQPVSHTQRWHSGWQSVSFSPIHAFPPPHGFYSLSPPPSSIPVPPFMLPHKDTLVKPCWLFFLGKLAHYPDSAPKKESPGAVRPRKQDSPSKKQREGRKILCSLILLIPVMLGIDTPCPVCSPSGNCIRVPIQGSKGPRMEVKMWSLSDTMLTSSQVPDTYCFIWSSHISFQNFGTGKKI